MSKGNQRERLSPDRSGVGYMNQIQLPALSTVNSEEPITHLTHVNCTELQLHMQNTPLGT